MTSPPKKGGERGHELEKVQFLKYSIGISFVHRAGGSSNGRTPVFGTVNVGPIPAPPAVCRKVLFS